MSKKTAPRNVLVNVDEPHRDKIEQVATKLRSAGMKVGEVFPLAGTIAGEVTSEALENVRSVKGVSSIEDEPVFRTY